MKESSCVLICDLKSHISTNSTRVERIPEFALRMMDTYPCPIWVFSPVRELGGIRVHELWLITIRKNDELKYLICDDVLILNLIPGERARE